MKSGGYLSIVKYFAIQVAVFESIILFLTGTICWWIGRWNLAGYSNGLSWAGGLVILFGIFSMFGGSQPASFGGTRQNFSFLIAPRNAETGQGTQFIQNLADGQLSAIVMVLAGITTFMIKAIINYFII